MAFTAIKVVEQGVLLYEQQLRRFERAAGPVGRDAFRDFAASVAPGTWVVWYDEARGLRAETRPGSRLFDGMPAQFLVSPLSRDLTLMDKMEPPGPYGPIRLDKISLLLTSADGSEIYESCSASVVAWDGQGLVCPPDDRPRIWSTAEALVREGLQVRLAPIPKDSQAILLLNAVKGSCSLLGHSEAFPAGIRAQIDALFTASARRP